MLMQEKITQRENSACFLDPFQKSEEPIMSRVSGPTRNIFMKKSSIYILQLQRGESRDAGVVALFLLNASKLRTKKCFFCVCVCK